MGQQVAEGVWVRQSVWVWSDSIVVRGDDGLVVIDPGINGDELDALADDVDALGLPVVAGFSTPVTGTTCCGTPGSATCRASGRPPTPVRRAWPESGRRRWRRRAQRTFLSIWSRC